MPFFFRIFSANALRSGGMPCGRQVVRAVVGHRLGDGLLERVGRVEGDVALIEAERILDGVHHVADADDGGDGNGIVELAHRVSVKVDSLELRRTLTPAFQNCIQGCGGFLRRKIAHVKVPRANVD